MIQASAALDRNLELGLTIADVKDPYAKTVRVQDYKTCLAVRKELSDLPSSTLTPKG